MKLTFKSPDGSLTVEAEPKTIKDGFDAIGQIKNLLMPEPCGCCKSKATYPASKTAGGYKFFEWVCPDCGAAMTLGEMKPEKGGHLFVKRKDKDGNVLPNKGWSVYQGNGQREAPHSQEPNKEPQQYADEEVPF